MYIVFLKLFSPLKTKFLFTKKLKREENILAITLEKNIEYEFLTNDDEKIYTNTLNNPMSIKNEESEVNI